MKNNRWTKHYTEWQPRRGKRSREQPCRRWQYMARKEGTIWNRKAIEDNGRCWWRTTFCSGCTKSRWKVASHLIGLRSENSHFHCADEQEQETKDVGIFSGEKKQKLQSKQDRNKRWVCNRNYKENGIGTKDECVTENTKKTGRNKGWVCNWNYKENRTEIKGECVTELTKKTGHDKGWVCNRNYKENRTERMSV